MTNQYLPALVLYVAPMWPCYQAAAVWLVRVVRQWRPQQHLQHEATGDFLSIKITRCAHTNNKKKLAATLCGS